MTDRSDEYSETGELQTACSLREEQTIKPKVEEIGPVSENASGDNCDDAQTIDSSSHVEEVSVVTQPLQEENKLPTVTNVGKHRAYIKNLPFDTSEEELELIFKDYNVLSTLIPTYTIRGFRSSKYKPLGVAYVEFKTAEDAKNAIEKFNGYTFNKRVLVVKNYQLNSYAAKKIASPQPEKIIESKDTIFIQKLPYKVTIDHIQKYFEDYNPGPIYLYESKHLRDKHRPLSINGRFRSALITLNSEIELSNIIDSLSTKFLLGKPVILRTAFLHKIEVVAKNESKRYKIISKIVETVPRDSPGIPEESINEIEIINIAQDPPGEQIPIPIPLSEELYSEEGTNSV